MILPFAAQIWFPTIALLVIATEASNTYFNPILIEKRIKSIKVIRHDAINNQLWHRHIGFSKTVFFREFRRIHTRTTPYFLF